MSFYVGSPRLDSRIVWCRPNEAVYHKVHNENTSTQTRRDITSKQVTYRRPTRVWNDVQIHQCSRQKASTTSYT